MHLNLSYLLSLAQLSLPVIVPAAAAWIVKHIKTPTDAERATILAHMAQGAVAYVLSTNRSSSWAQLLKTAVDQVVNSMNPPTGNRDAITRAVSAALLSHGIKPDTLK